MKNTGIIRRIDELGRIVIPKEIRTKINIKKKENSCMLKKKKKNLKSFNDKLLCDNCISKISKLIEN